MSIVVPGKCWTTAITGPGSETYFGVLGPLAEGDYLRRLQITIMANGKGTGRFAASFGPSEQPNQASMSAGVPVIQRSTAAIGGVPAFEFFVVDGVTVNLVIPVGVRSTVGARYLIFYVRAGTADVGYTFIVSLDVLRADKADRG